MKKAVNSGLILLSIGALLLSDVGCGSASTPRWGASPIAVKERNRVRSSAVRPQDAIQLSLERI